jgi:hypothetical protein
MPFTAGRSASSTPRLGSRRLAILASSKTYHVIEEVRDRELAGLLPEYLKARDPLAEKGDGPVFSDCPDPSRQNREFSLSVVDSPQ